MPKADTKRTRNAKPTPQRRKKDPNAPKRGLSAYMFFANDTRDKVREENEGISFGAVGKELGRKWKEMTDEDKKPYNEKAAKDKKRYEDESKAYKAKQEAEEGNPSDEESA